MNFSTFKEKMDTAGDAYVYYKSPVSGKQKYHICTMDFSTEYINKKLKEQTTGSIPLKPGTIKVFCWDLDDFKRIDVASVQQIVPLNSVITN